MFYFKMSSLVDWKDLAQRIAKRKRDGNDDYTPAKTSHRRAIDRIGEYLGQRLTEHITQHLTHVAKQLGKKGIHYLAAKAASSGHQPKINYVNNKIAEVKSFVESTLQTTTDTLKSALGSIQNKVTQIFGEKVGSTLNKLISKAPQLEIAENPEEIETLLKTLKISEAGEEAGLAAAEAGEEVGTAAATGIADSVGEAAAGAFGPAALALGFGLDITGGDKVAEKIGTAIEGAINLIPDTDVGKGIKTGINTGLGTLGDTFDVILDPIEDISRWAFGTQNKARKRLTSDNDYEIFKQMIHDNGYIGQGNNSFNWADAFSSILAPISIITGHDGQTGYYQEMYKMYAPNDYAARIADYKSKTQFDDEHSGENVAKVELGV